ncbi:MAG TPA: tetratricopeptide repeat protein [Anaerolineae bacterium]|nr:tetratricopeptide repeat protein [Anaerolineae bacterium]
MQSRTLRSFITIRLFLLSLFVVLVAAACNQQPPSPLDAGRSALQSGDANKAITELEKLITDQPASAPAHLLLGQAYFKAGRKDDAKSQFQAGFSLDPAATLVITSTDAEEVFLTGNVHATLGQFDQALQAYSTTLQIDPSKAGAYTNIGVVYYQTGKLDIAVQQFQQALAIDPKDADTNYLLGAAYVQKNDLENAAKFFQTALMLDPNSTAAYIGLGNVDLLRKNYEQAVTNLQKALNLQPDSPEALFGLGKAYYLQGNNAAAITTLTQFLQLNPAEPYKSDAQKILQQLGAK